jgi:hypothetical protein
MLGGINRHIRSCTILSLSAVIVDRSFRVVHPHFLEQKAVTHHAEAGCMRFYPPSIIPDDSARFVHRYFHYCKFMHIVLHMRLHEHDQKYF